MKGVFAAYTEISYGKDHIDFLRDELRSAGCPLFYCDGNKKREAESLSGYYILLCMLRKRGREELMRSIVKDSMGRPYFEGETGLDFNISHTSGFAVCALGEERRVGADTEGIPVGRVRNRIATRFFTTEEKKEYASAGMTEEAFATVWTRKEAYCKYTGNGICGVSEPEAGISGVTFVTKRIFVGERRFIITVCTDRRNEEDAEDFQSFDKIETAPK